MRFLGVDGCSKGWFLISIDPDGNFGFDMFDQIDPLWHEYKNSSLILIDIPIGLPHWRSRRCDVAARKILGKRGSSVFPAPSRTAINQLTYEDACAENQKILGKKLSLQTWNISSKIKQVDRLMDRDHFARNIIRESHPEICFWALAGGKAMTYNKKSEPGIEERLNIFKKINSSAEELFETVLRSIRRKDLAKDDILDAMALAITAASPEPTFATIPEQPERDLNNLPMEIVYTKRYLK